MARPERAAIIFEGVETPPGEGKPSDLSTQGPLLITFTNYPLLITLTNYPLLITLTNYSLLITLTHYSLLITLTNLLFTNYSYPLLVPITLTNYFPQLRESLPRETAVLASAKWCAYKYIYIYIYIYIERER